jgi:hypothetical protein
VEFDAAPQVLRRLHLPPVPARAVHEHARSDDERAHHPHAELDQRQRDQQDGETDDDSSQEQAHYAWRVEIPPSTGITAPVT